MTFPIYKQIDSPFNIHTQMTSKKNARSRLSVSHMYGFYRRTRRWQMAAIWGFLHIFTLLHAFKYIYYSLYT